MNAVTQQMRQLLYAKSWPIAWGLLGIVAAGCTTQQPPGNRENPKVEVSKPIIRKVTDSEEFTGHTEAKETVEIRARVTGTLDKVFFTEGREVKKGEPLVLIDSRPYKLAVAAADAAAEQAKSNLVTLKDVRDRNVATGSGISEQETNKSINDYNAGVATLNRAKADLDTAKLNLEWTTITSPVTGIVGKRMIDPGNMVQANTTPIIVIRSDNPIYGYFDVDERTVLRLRRGHGTLAIASTLGLSTNHLDALLKKQTVVQYAVADDTGYSPSRTGVVDFEDNQIDISTGTQRFRCTIENNNHLLLPGNFLRVRFLLGEPYDAVVITERAIGTDQGQKYVFVVDDDGKVHQRNIKVGQLDNGMRVILDGALKPNERVVVVGLQRVREGVTVDAKEVPMPTGPPGAKTVNTNATTK